MHENGKKKPVETILRIGGEGVKENDGGSEFNYNSSSKKEQVIGVILSLVYFI
jgi:hypothetical protein